MSSGTITLTNNSAVVSGSSTSFSSDLTAGDFIVSVIGGVTYTLPIRTIDSDTQVTLIKAYDGPSMEGAAWSSVPRDTMNSITAQLAAETAKALRGLNYDKANWQQVFSRTGNITVTLPDGSTYTGPAWNNAASKGANNDITSLSGLDTPLSIKQGGTGSNNAKGALSSLGAFPSSGGVIGGAITVPSIEVSSSTPYIDFHFGSSISDFTTRLISTNDAELTLSAAASSGAKLRIEGGYGTRSGMTGGFGSNYFNFLWSGGQIVSYIDNTQVGAISLTSVSDKGFKKDISYCDSENGALGEVVEWRPATFKMKERGIIPESEDQLGFIANDLVKTSPECVTGTGLPDDYDPAKSPNDIGSAYALNEIAIIAKLTLAIQEQQKQIEEIKSQLAKILSSAN